LKNSLFFSIFIFLIVIPISYSATSGTFNVSTTVIAACSGNDTSCGTDVCINCNELDGYYDDLFCYLGNVVKEYRDYYCDGFECAYTSTYPIFENCTYGCQNGECVYYSGYGGSGGLVYISGLETSISEMKYSGVIVPSTPEELSSITLSPFTVKNTGARDTTVKIQFSCNQYNFCSAAWCRADRSTIPLKSNESAVVEIYCIIPEEIQPETDYKMDIFISNTYDDVKKITVTLPVPSEQIIMQELAKRAKRRQVTKTTTTAVGVGASIVLLYFMVKPKSVKFKRKR